MMLHRRLVKKLSCPDTTFDEIKQLEQQLLESNEIISYTRLCQASILSGVAERFHRYFDYSDSNKRGFFLPFSIMSRSLNMVFVVAEAMSTTGLSYIDIIEYAISGKWDDPDAIIAIINLIGIRNDLTLEKNLKLRKLAQEAQLFNLLKWMEKNCNMQS